MTRFVVLLAICVAAVGLGSVACGGNDKPPLTPDTEVKDLGDAGASAPSAPSAAPAPAK